MLLIGDNFGLALCVQKGRCALRPSLRLIQRIVAECLAADIEPRYRWVPSELHLAVHLSRL